MDQIELLKKKNKYLRRNIKNNNNAILFHAGILLIIAIASLGGGAVLGLILDKMAKNGNVTEYMKKTVYDNNHKPSLINWAKSFR